MANGERRIGYSENGTGQVVDSSHERTDGEQQHLQSRDFRLPAHVLPDDDRHRSAALRPVTRGRVPPGRRHNSTRHPRTAPSFRTDPCRFPSGAPAWPRVVRPVRSHEPPSGRSCEARERLVAGLGRADPA